MNLKTCAFQTISVRFRPYLIQEKNQLKLENPLSTHHYHLFKSRECGIETTTTKTDLSHDKLDARLSDMRLLDNVSDKQLLKLALET
jgi:hypothetical protein